MKLERYDELQVRQEGVSVGPGSQTPTYSRSGSDGLAQGIGSLATAASKIGAIVDEERQRAEEMKVSDSDLRFAQEASDILYNGETGYLNTQGGNALDTGSVHEKIEALRQKYVAGLPTQRAQEAFDRRSRVRADAFRTTVERHAGAEREKLYDATVAQAQQVAQDGAVLVYNQFDEKTGVNEKVETLIALNFETLVPYLRNKGVPADQIEKAKDASAAKVYAAVLGEYKAKRDFTGGKKFLESVRDHMGDKAAAFETIFNEGAKEAEIAKEGLETFNAIRERPEVTDAATGRFNPAAARAFFETFDPAFRAKNDAYVEKLITQADTDQKAEDVQRLARLSRGVRDTSVLDKNSEDYLALDDRGKDVADAMLVRDAREKKMDNAANRQAQVIENNTAANRFLALTPAQRIEMTDEQLRGTYTQVDKEGFSDLQRLREGARAALERGAAVSQGTFEARVDSIATGLFGSKNHAKAKREEFKKGMADWYAAQMTAQKDPSEQEVSERLGRAVILYDLPVSLGNPLGTDKYGYQLDDVTGLTPAPLAQQKFPALVAKYLTPSGAPSATPTAKPAAKPAAPAARVIKNTTTGKRANLKPGFPVPAGWELETK